MRAYLIDSQPLFREGLKNLVSTVEDFRVVGDSSTYEELPELIQQVKIF